MSMKLFIAQHLLRDLNVLEFSRNSGSGALLSNTFRSEAIGRGIRECASNARSTVLVFTTMRGSRQTAVESLIRQPTSLAYLNSRGILPFFSSPFFYLLFSFVSLFLFYWKTIVQELLAACTIS